MAEILLCFLLTLISSDPISGTNLKNCQTFLISVMFYLVFEAKSEKHAAQSYTAADIILIFLILLSSSFLLSK